MDKKTLMGLIKEENEHLGDPYENEVGTKSWHIGALCAALVGALLYFFEWFVWGENSLVALAPTIVMFAVTCTLQAIRLKTVRKIVMAVLFCILSALFVVIMVLDYGFGWR